MSIEDVFRKREQRISFELMSIESPFEILNAYEKEQAKIESKNGEEAALTPDEIGLYFYFATFLKQNITSNHIF